MAIAQEKEDKSATAAATDDDAKKSPSGLKSYMVSPYCGFMAEQES